MWGRWPSSNFPSSAPGGEGGGEGGEIHHPGHFLSDGFTTIILIHQNTCSIMYVLQRCYIRLIEPLLRLNQSFKILEDCSRKTMWKVQWPPLCVLYFLFLLKINHKKLYFGLHQKRHETALAIIVCLTCVASSALSSTCSTFVFGPVFVCLWICLCICYKVFVFVHHDMLDLHGASKCVIISIVLHSCLSFHQRRRHKYVPRTNVHVWFTIGRGAKQAVNWAMPWKCIWKGKGSTAVSRSRRIQWNAIWQLVRNWIWRFNAQTKLSEHWKPTM